MTSTQADDEEDDLPRYNVRLLVRHPNIDPERITNTLRLAPHLSAIAGSARRNPKGAILPGVHRHSVWSHSFRLEGNRRFFSDVVNLINKLEPHKTFLVELANSGGSICLIVDLPGDTNIGDVLSWREMARLSALQIDLGIEVFPEFN
jgi:hypothetical protein